MNPLEYCVQFWTIYFNGNSDKSKQGGVRHKMLNKIEEIHYLKRRARKEKRQLLRNAAICKEEKDCQPQSLVLCYSQMAWQLK